MFGIKKTPPKLPTWNSHGSEKVITLEGRYSIHTFWPVVDYYILIGR